MSTADLVHARKTMSSMTVASATTAVIALAGAPLRGDVSPSARGPQPSRQNANTSRLAPAADPSALANALAVAPSPSSVAIHAPMYSEARSLSGAAEEAKVAAPAGFAP